MVDTLLTTGRDDVAYVYGYSDDIVYVEVPGDTYELYPDEFPGEVLLSIDGHRVEVTYTDSGMWQCDVTDWSACRVGPTYNNTRRTNDYSEVAFVYVGRDRPVDVDIVSGASGNRL